MSSDVASPTYIYIPFPGTRTLESSKTMHQACMISIAA